MADKNENKVEINQQELQQKMMEMEMLQQQVQQIQQQLEMVSQQVDELNSTREALNDVNQTGPGDEVLVPMGAGIFMKADSRAQKEFIINVGSDVAVGKTSEEAIDMIKIQLGEMQKVQGQLQENSQKLNVRAQTLQQELQENRG